MYDITHTYDLYIYIYNHHITEHPPALTKNSKDKTKLSKESVVKMYVEPKFECKVVKDHAAIGSEKKMPVVGDK